MVHLHVRDPMGQPTCKTEIFQDVIQRIRAQSDLIIQVSTGGAVGDSETDRMRPLDAGPDMASLTTGTTNFGEAIFLNPYPFVKKLAQAMSDKNIKPEIEVFDNAMLETALRMVDQNLLDEPLHIDLVMGVPGAMAASEENLNFLLEKIPSHCTWSLAAVGKHQYSMVEMALKKGGHVRVGMEDNLYLEKGQMAKSNAELVAKASQMAKKLGRSIASPKMAREILHLKKSKLSCSFR